MDAVSGFQTPAPPGAGDARAAERRLSGVCHALVAFDVGFAIDLDKAEALAARPAAGKSESPASEPRLELRRSRRAPTSFRFEPTPLRIQLGNTPETIGGLRIKGPAEALLFDFGAVSLTYHIPFDGDADDVLRLSEALYENAGLQQDARRRVERLVQAIESAVTKPDIVSLVEDYMIFEIRSAAPATGVDQIIAEQGSFLARILRSERRALSQQEMTDALGARVSYGLNDATLIDWNAAIVLDEDPEDTLAILEYANVELLELRLLDDRLDQSLEQAYAAVTRAQRGWAYRLGLMQSHAGMRRIAQLQVDSAALFEGVNNALKLVGDQFLARVYRVASFRMRLGEWDASILRKLQALESMYEKASDQVSTRRMEVLEWIIILLIAFEVVMGFVR